MIKVILKILLTIVSLIVLLFGISVFLYTSADLGDPNVMINVDDYHTYYKGDTLCVEDSYIHKDSSGLWELYVSGSGISRGAKQGVLTKELMRYQEDVFINKIKDIVPSDSYLGFLKRLIIIFNRNLGKYVPFEYREEIAAMSKFCTEDYNAIGTPYERQLNYHAAHDIGHAMQQYMLVGCSSFGVWDDKSADSTLVVGRNFDFYLGDDFAENKLITFAMPDSGYKYVSIGWAGMIGVLSGMNECGLTVTINASKGAIPTSAATPISILTREILQYASNIEQAYSIASSRTTFVSESILIGSDSDNRCAIIEKTPSETVLYMHRGDVIISTNHFLSERMSNNSYNEENIENSDSKYRYDRLEQLLEQNYPIDLIKSVSILRDRFGKDGIDIGIGNEMTLNQSIGHHSVVFKPSEKKIWISTKPWQSGQIVCYDLKEFFEGTSKPIRRYDLDIEEDKEFITNDLQRLLSYREGIELINNAIEEEKELDRAYILKFLEYNPNHFFTYKIVGDYLSCFGDNTKAIMMYKHALQCSIPYKSERKEIESIIKEREK